MSGHSPFPPASSDNELDGHPFREFFQAQLEATQPHIKNRPIIKLSPSLLRSGFATITILTAAIRPFRQRRTLSPASSVNAPEGHPFQELPILK